MFFFLLLFLPIASLNGAQDGIQPYRQEHEAAVAVLALAHMPALASTFIYTPEEYEALLKSQVLPALKNALETEKQMAILKAKGQAESNESNRYFAQVYMHEGRPVGFVTYGIKDPWYRPLLPDTVSREIGPNAMIHHLAVDSKVAGNGYGKRLVEHALADCKEKSVNRVDLWTTGSSSPKLASFYGNQGFELTRRTKFNEQCYTKRLQPSPALVVARAALRLLSSIRK